MLLQNNFIFQEMEVLWNNLPICFSHEQQPAVENCRNRKNVQ